MNCIIVTPDKTLFEGDIIRLMAPGYYGQLAILPGHTPLYSELKAGKIEVTDTNQKQEEFDIEGGIIRIRTDSVTVVVGF